MNEQIRYEIIENLQSQINQFVNQKRQIDIAIAKLTGYIEALKNDSK